MTVYEADLPGVGKKFEVELGDDERLVIVIHNTGRRELFRRPSPDADAEKLLELSDRLARQVGTIMEGAYFQPVETGTVDTVLGENTVIEWVKLPEGSPLAGRTLADTGLRQATGASVIAIQRAGTEEPEPNPDADTEMREGDTLIVLGTREACGAVEELATTEAEADVDADEGAPSG